MAAGDYLSHLQTTPICITVAVAKLKFVALQTLLDHIGACRAVWVPGQDLATPHLMRNCGKRILSSLYTVHMSVCA